MPSGGRPSASVRALQTATTRSWRSAARSATGSSRGAGRVDRAGDAALDRDGRAGHARRGARTRPRAPCRRRSSRRAGSPPGRGRGGAPRRGPRRRRGRGRRAPAAAHRRAIGVAGAVAAERDVGLDRREVAAAVEDDRQLVAQREAVDAHRHGGRARLVEQRAPEKFLGGCLVASRTCSLMAITHTTVSAVMRRDRR